MSNFFPGGPPEGSGGPANLDPVSPASSESTPAPLRPERLIPQPPSEASESVQSRPIPLPSDFMTRTAAHRPVGEEPVAEGQASASADEPPTAVTEPNTVGQATPAVPPAPKAVSEVNVRPASEFPETDIYDRAKALQLPENSSVVIASSALEAVVGPDVRRGADLDLAVTEEGYRAAREKLLDRSGVEEVYGPNGPRLVGDGLDIGMDWEGTSTAALQRGAFREQGVDIAGLPDIYAQKQARGEPKDLRDLEIINARLDDPKLLPAPLLRPDLERVQGIMPEHLRARPELSVAASGLYVVRTRFGAGDSVRSYSGSAEQGPVPAFYHREDHSWDVLRKGVQSLDALGDATDDEYLSVAAAAANHDRTLGGGRESANPLGFDEKVSAEQVAAQLAAAGAGPPVVEGAYAGTRATGFNEATKAQDINPDRGYLRVQHNVAGPDLGTFSSVAHAEGSELISLEDMFREGAGVNAPAARIVRDFNESRPAGAPPMQVTAAAQARALIDRFPDYPVVRRTPNGTAEIIPLAQAYGNRMTNSGRFGMTYRYPHDYRLADPATQERHGSFVAEVGERVARRAITATQAGQEIAAFTAAERERLRRQ